MYEVLMTPHYRRKSFKVSVWFFSLLFRHFFYTLLRVISFMTSIHGNDNYMLKFFLMLVDVCRWRNNLISTFNEAHWVFPRMFDKMHSNDWFQFKRNFNARTLIIFMICWCVYYLKYCMRTQYISIRIIYKIIELIYSHYVIIATKCI